MKFECSRQIFEKFSNTEFHANPVQLEPSCSMRTYGQTDGKTDTTKLIVAFFAILRAFLKILHSAHRIYYVFFLCVSEQTAILDYTSNND